MKNRSKINKGNRLVAYILAEVQRVLDVHAKETRGSGSGMDKGDIVIPSLNMRVEAKNAKTVSLVKDWEQAKAQAFHDQVPVLMIRNPKLPEFQEVIVAISMQTFLRMALSAKENGDNAVLTQATFTYKQTQALNSLKTAMRQYERETESGARPSVSATARLGRSLKDVRDQIPTLQ